MTLDQAKQLDAVLKAAEDWLLAVLWAGSQPAERAKARQEVVAEIDEFLSALELEQ